VLRLREKLFLCVCVRGKGEAKRGGGEVGGVASGSTMVCARACVERERARKRERERGRERERERERERDGVD
jgi:hypothetical protein